MVRAREVDAESAEAVLGYEGLQAVGSARLELVDESDGGELAGESFEGVAHIAVVEQVVNGLDDDGLVDSRLGHPSVQELHAAVFV